MIEVPVVATAGHVDHGKSTLVRALTGQDPDRLEEERRRGLSIELGYCWTALDPIGDVAFVDVPGHERFLSTTLAGLGPVSVVMLVIAADDPWMPQTAEHLAAIDAFGIRHGLLVVTRSDLADPGPALERARSEVASTTLAGAPAVMVSGRTGSGLDDLRSALVTVLDAAAATDRPAGSEDVRLWVDRHFTVPGAGTVVTGTLPSGVVRVGDELASGGRIMRVRGLESLGRELTQVTGPARVALRLGGRTAAEFTRGDALVTPGAYVDVTELDVRLHGHQAPPERPLLHVGSRGEAVRVRPLGDGFARLRLRGPLPLRHGDRLVLRDPGHRSLWGADVLDADPPALSRRGAARQRRAELETSRPDLGDELRRRGVGRRSRLARLGVDTTTVPHDVVVAGDWLVSDEQMTRWRTDLNVLVSTTGQGGIAPESAARALGVPDPDLVALLVRPPIVVRGGRLVLDRDPSPHLAQALAALRDDLEEDPFAAPTRDRLDELGLGRGDLACLARDGHLLSLGEGVVLLPDADRTACRILRGLPQPFTTSEARRALRTSRRVVLPLLALLDRVGDTVRLADDTRRVVEPGR